LTETPRLQLVKRTIRCIHLGVLRQISWHLNPPGDWEPRLARDAPASGAPLLKLRFHLRDSGGVARLAVGALAALVDCASLFDLFLEGGTGIERRHRRTREDDEGIEFRGLVAELDLTTSALIGLVLGVDKRTRRESSAIRLNHFARFEPLGQQIGGESLRFIAETELDGVLLPFVGGEFEGHL
jgi:hypothetical protein